MRFEVTQKDIDSGTRLDAKGCPIARASKRELRENFVAVGPETISYWNPELILDRAKLPNEAVDFIANFDSRYPVKPFEFEVDLKGYEDAN